MGTLTVGIDRTLLVLAVVMLLYTAGSLAYLGHEFYKDIRQFFKHRRRTAERRAHRAKEAARTSSGATLC